MRTGSKEWIRPIAALHTAGIYASGLLLLATMLFRVNTNNGLIPVQTIKFIHTSDLHLDTSFSGSGFPSQLGARKREAIRATLRRILEKARTENVSFLLIAGDLFEHDRVTADTVEFLRLQFENLVPMPVFIAPGNHDPAIPGSPYIDERWPDNVHIFKTEEFQSVELKRIGVRITGFGFARTHIEEHPCLALAPLPQDAFNVLVFHGSDVSRVPLGKTRHAPFSPEELTSKNIGYCALGHYHQQGPVGGAQSSVWYSGIPEGRGWDEEGAHGFLLVEIEGGTVRVHPMSSGQYPLRTLTIVCDGLASREQILERILERKEDVFDPQTILRIRLQGALDPRVDLAYSEMEERLRGEVLHLAWDNQTHAAVDYDSLALEKTLRGHFVRALNARIAAAPDEEKPMLELARYYGVEALLDREVRLR